MNREHLRAFDLNLLVVLDALLRHGNVTQAARNLGMTQSATSRALARLREQMADELLVRSGSGMLPTPRAEAMRAPLRRLLDETSALLSADRDFHPSSIQRRFMVASADYPTMTLLPVLSQSLESQAPNATISLVPFSLDFGHALEAGTLDFAIGPKRKSRAGVIWSELFQDGFVSVVRKGHPRVGKKLPRRLFTSESHILVDPEPTGKPGVVDRALAKHGESRRLSIRVPTFLSALHLVADSDLLATVPGRLARQFSAKLSLRVLKTPLTLRPVTVHLAWHERLRRDPAHRWLREEIRKAAAAA